MSLLESCKENFGTDNLYEVLSVGEKASETELKKAYKRVSLNVHPDRVDESQKLQATRKFQTLAQVYYILSDVEKRAIYDETGCVEEDNSLSGEKDWEAYWNCLFPKIKIKDIENFMEKYKGSEEEIEDLKKCYISCDGDMNQISMHLMGYTIEDEERYKDILNDLIKKKEIPSFPKFAQEKAAKRSARKAKFKKEAQEAESMRKEMKLDEDMSSLTNAIMNRTRDRESQFTELIKGLESKYAKPSRSRSSKK